MRAITIGVGSAPCEIGSRPAWVGEVVSYTEAARRAAAQPAGRILTLRRVGGDVVANIPTGRGCKAAVQRALAEL